MNKYLLFLSLFLNISLSSTPSARASIECDVPICDVSSSVESLRAATQAVRFSTVSNLRNTYKNNKDPKVWKNLRNFAKAAGDIFNQVGEEDWVKREASTLFAESTVGLAKYSIPVKSADLSAWYADLPTQDSRFGILHYWADLAKVSEDLDELRELIEFAKNASQMSVSAGDEDYVLREANSILTNSTRVFLKWTPIMRVFIPSR